MRSSIEISTTTTSGCIATSRRATSIPLDVRHAHVEQHEVRRERRHGLDPALAAVGLADGLEARRRRDDIAGDRAEDRLIVDGQYAH